MLRIRAESTVSAPPNTTSPACAGNLTCLPQADFLLQFWYIACSGDSPCDPALRKLPMFSYALAPEYLVPAVNRDDADVRAIAFTIDMIATHQN